VSTGRALAEAALAVAKERADVLARARRALLQDPPDVEEAWRCLRIMTGLHGAKRDSSLGVRPHQLPGIVDLADFSPGAVESALSVAVTHALEAFGVEGGERVIDEERFVRAARKSETLRRLLASGLSRNLLGVLVVAYAEASAAKQNRRDPSLAELRDGIAALSAAWRVAVGPQPLGQPRLLAVAGGIRKLQRQWELAARERSGRRGPRESIALRLYRATEEILPERGRRQTVSRLLRELEIDTSADAEKLALARKSARRRIRSKRAKP
jgi:hypothetical protein